MAKIQSAGGIGESKVFAAPSSEERPVRHINGVPIPPELAHQTPYALTDEGKAEAAARPGPEPSGISVLTDETRPGRHAERFKDAASGGMPWDRANEMRRLMEEHRPAVDAKMRWLSDDVNSKLGTRGYQVVKDERGEPVRFGNSVLGTVPGEVARTMEQHFIDRSPKVEEVKAAHEEQMRRGLVNGVPAVSSAAIEQGTARALAGLQDQGGFRD
jgi:hypothetical protein